MNAHSMLVDRRDLRLIAERVNSNSRVLDLACGDGALLDYLQHHKQVRAYGLEIAPKKIEACIRRGVNVIQANLDNGLRNFADQQFDHVIMALSLQAMQFPSELLKEMVRVGRDAIVSFPNMAHWRSRWHLGVRGRMPVTKALPHAWYDTPNIHLCSVADFEQLCAELKIRIVERVVGDYLLRETWTSRMLPNWFGQSALYRIEHL